MSTQARTSPQSRSPQSRQGLTAALLRRAGPGAVAVVADVLRAQAVAAGAVVLGDDQASLAQAVGRGQEVGELGVGRGAVDRRADVGAVVAVIAVAAIVDQAGDRRGAVDVGHGDVGAGVGHSDGAGRRDEVGRGRRRRRRDRRAEVDVGVARAALGAVGRPERWAGQTEILAADAVPGSDAGTQAVKPVEPQALELPLSVLVVAEDVVVPREPREVVGDGGGLGGDGRSAGGGGGGDVGGRSGAGRVVVGATRDNGRREWGEVDEEAVGLNGRADYRRARTRRVARTGLMTRRRLSGDDCSVH